MELLIYEAAIPEGNKMLMRTMEAFVEPICVSDAIVLHDVITTVRSNVFIFMNKQRSILYI